MEVVRSRWKLLYEQAVFVALRTISPRIWAQATGLIGFFLGKGHTLRTNFRITAPEVLALSVNHSLPFVVFVSIVRVSLVAVFSMFVSLQ